ncbi:MAG: S8 family serine peptidase [Bacteroidota bacterium]
MRGFTMAFLSLLLWGAEIHGQTQTQTSTTKKPVLEANFKSGSTNPDNWVPVQEIQQYAWENSYVEGSLYLLVQFQDFPSLSEQKKLEQEGLKLLYYIPAHTYLAKVQPTTNLAATGITQVAPYLPSYKYSSELTHQQIPLHAYQDNRFWVQVKSFPDITVAQLETRLWSRGFKPQRSGGDVLRVQLSLAELETLTQEPAVMYVEPVESTSTPEGVRGRTLHAVNLVNTGAETGYDGSSVAVAVADDGTVFHEDLKGRTTHHTTSNVGDHGEMVVGILAGAGNIDPLALGVAPGTEVHIFKIDGYTHVTNAISNYQSLGTVVTSTSYGEGCGAFYNTNANFLDAQMYQHDRVLHVFSAGNSANSDCNTKYGSITDQFGKFFGNIAGGRKSSKHAIAVANVLYNDQLHGSSSRGPTLDGRIKPDISGQGQGNLTIDDNNGYRLGGGTSAAAPSVAGVAALLFEAYQSVNNGVKPAASLVKAVLLNSAEDIFLPGPDYFTGWGRVHAKRAIETVEQGNIRSGQVANKGNSLIQVTVPAGMAQARFMIYWLDPAGAPMANRALVNDLDMRVQLPNGQYRQPWVLPISANLDSLMAPAYAGYDRVNNMEQVVIDNPQAGSYRIRVKGHAVPQGPQSFYLVYTFVEKSLALTYPVGGESMVPGETEVIRWDALEDYGTFELQYSVDNKSTWTTIDNAVSGTKRSYDWRVPNAISGEVFIRIKRGSRIETSPGRFHILGQPQFVFNTESSQEAFVSWPPVPGANRYDVYRLEDKYMKIIGTTSGTNYAIDASPQQQDWYSVRARYNDQIIGRRSFAKAYTYLPCEVPVSLQIDFDIYPAETRWEIQNLSNQVVASGGPYNGYDNFSNIVIEKCLPEGCYRLHMYDALGDGICCSNGQGSYALSTANGTILASGGNFGSEASHYFCIDEDMDDGNDDNPPSTLTIASFQLEQNSCGNGANGWISVQAAGGSGSYTYLWSNGQVGSTITQLGAGNYTVTISDGDQQLVRTYTITSPPPIVASVSATDIGCNMGNGTASVVAAGGNPPYAYSWSSGANGPAVAGLNSGSHAVTITDQNNCSIVKYFDVQLIGDLELSFYTADVSCPDDQNGVAVVVATGGQGPYSYLWGNGETNYFLVNQAIGTYPITVTDIGGCTVVGAVTIAGPAPITVDFTKVSPRCGTNNTGSITAFISGGAPPYDVAWNTGATTNAISQLGTGDYWINITDGGGCTYLVDVALDGIIEMDITGIAGTVENEDDGYIDVNVNNGTPPYVYQWSNGASTEDLDNLPPGSYTLTVTDAGGCQKIKTFIVEAMLDGYCTAQSSSTTYEWIERVSLGSSSIVSGANGGYIYHEATTWTLFKNGGYLLVLTPGYLGTAYKEYWHVWIDYNQDGDFEDLGETVYTAYNIAGQVQGAIQVPNTALLGTTRMRVAMKYGASPPACDNFGYGEVEDFNILITTANGSIARAPEQSNQLLGTTFTDTALEIGNADAPTEQASALTISMYPNPANDRIFLALDKAIGEAITFSFYNKLGQLIHQENAPRIEQPTHALDISGLSPGIYSIVIRVEDRYWTERLVVAGSR